MQGWIAVHRILLEKSIWLQSTPEQKVVLMTILLLADHDGNEWEWKGEKYRTNPGEFITSLESIQKRSGKGISIQNVRSSLKRFEKLGFLTNKSTNKNRLITVVNWKSYQPQKDKPTSKPTDNQQATNKQPTTNNNVIMEKCKEKELVPKGTRGTGEPHTKIIEEWNSLPVQNIKAMNAGTNRYKMLNARVKEYGMEEVVKAINNINESSFLKGQNKNGWNITFDWFVKPNNFVKVLEGNYSDDGDNQNQTKRKAVKF